MRGMGRSSTGARLVGRRDQLRLLDEAVGLAGAGEPQFVVFGGEAGVGKTHLLEHCAVRLEESGWRALRGACVELGAEGLPLAPATAALRDLVHQVGVDRVSALLPGADAVLTLLPEMRGPQALPDTQARLFELFAAVLRRLGDDHPVLLVIDDLHWADKSTRELVGFLARTLLAARVLVVMAYRTDTLGRRHPLPAFLAELERLRGVRRVELPRFGRAETEELVAEVLGRHPSAALVDRVFRLSSGNAFFVEELASAQAAGGPSSLPESVRDLLLDRVERLPEASRDVVRMAAAGGPSLSHRLLAEIAGLDERPLLERLRVAVDARVLAAEEGEYAYRFRHALLREAVVDDLLPAERVRLHRAYAEALEARPGLAPAERYAAEVAFHWYGAGEADKALPALVRAAAAAEAVCAHAEQGQMLLRALDQWARVPDAPRLAGLDRVDIWEKLIGANLWAGEDHQALDLADQALAETDQAAAPERAAMLLALRGMALRDLGRDGALTAVEEALNLLPPAPSAGRARVLDLLGAVLMTSGRPKRAHALSREAMRIAADLGDEVVEANARTTVGVTLAQLGAYDEALATLREARDGAEERGDATRLTRAHLNLAVVLGTVGRHEETVGAATAGLDIAGRAGLSRTLGSILTVILATALTAMGRWDEADATCAGGLAADPSRPLGAAMHAIRGEIALARGEFEYARDQQSLATTLLGQASADPGRLLVLRLAAAIALHDNRIGDARKTVADALAVSGEGSPAADVWRLVTLGAQVESRARMRARTFGDGSAGEPITGALRAAAAAFPVGTPLSSACAAQVAAELGPALGPELRADVSWSEVVSAWEALGEPYSAAYARLRAAERAAEAGDRVSARDWLRRAADDADRLGAIPLLAEIRVLSRAADVATDTTPVRAAAPSGIRRLGLTEREAEVLRLVMAGHSNRGIAQQLFISPKTVSAHVSRVLHKLGVAGRVEATAAAYRLRLFEEDPGG